MIDGARNERGRSEEGPKNERWSEEGARNERGRSADGAMERGRGHEGKILHSIELIISIKFI